MKIGLKQILLYALAIVAPGGLVAVAGYHTYRFVKARVQKRRALAQLTSTEKQKEQND